MSSIEIGARYYALLHSYLCVDRHMCIVTAYQAAVGPFLRVCMVYVCSGLSHLTASVRIDAVSILLLILTRCPQHMWDFHEQVPASYMLGYAI